MYYQTSYLVYPDKKRINKQLDFANKTGARYAMVIGEDEMISGELTLKDLQLGEQQKSSLEELIAYLKEWEGLILKKPSFLKTIII